MCSSADENGEMISTLGCETTAPGTEVTFEVYLLDDAAVLPDDGEAHPHRQARLRAGAATTPSNSSYDSLIVEGGQRFPS